MHTEFPFPAVSIVKTDSDFEAIACIKLVSILKGDLLCVKDSGARGYDSPLNPLDPDCLQKNREALLRALASWDDSITLELDLTAVPNIAQRTESRLLLSIFLRCRASSEERAREEAYRRYLSLLPLLASHMPETEFSAVTDEQELTLRLAPFQAGNVLAILRKYEAVSLAAPLKRFSVGFAAPPETDDCPEIMINLVSDWVPSFDDWGCLLETVQGQLDPLRIVVRIRPGASTLEAAERCQDTISICEKYLAGLQGHQVTLTRQASLLRDRALTRLAEIGSPCFNVAVFIFTENFLDRAVASVIGHAITADHNPSDPGSLFHGEYSCAPIAIHDALDPGFFPDSEPFSPRESACAFRLPSPPYSEICGLPVRRSRTAPAFLPPIDPQKKGVIHVATNTHRGATQPVLLTADDRTRHAFIIGATGTGKSTLMETTILQNIKAGLGCAVIDPHGEMVQSLLSAIPKERAEDVILFDILDRERPVGFNLLQWSTLEERDLIIDELYLTMDHIYDMKQTGGPIFESNFRGMLKLLMGDGPRSGFVPTLLEFTLCYQSREFRAWLKETISDQQVIDFLEELEETKGEGMINNLSPYITSKFSRFLHDSTLKRIIGQEKSGIDFDDIMNNGKIFLAKLGKGRFGSVVSALLAHQMVSRFKFAAMKRGEIPPEQRKDFHIFVDEAQNLPVEGFVELLSEARKYRMGLTLATQYLAQLETDNRTGSLLPAVLGNVSSLFVFRLGQEDSVRIAPVLEPHFSARDITGLPNWQGYMRVQTGHDTVPPFSFTTIKDESHRNMELAGYLRELSRLTYGRDVRIVDREIAMRRNAWKQDRS